VQKRGRNRSKTLNTWYCYFCSFPTVVLETRAENELAVGGSENAGIWGLCSAQMVRRFFGFFQKITNLRNFDINF